MPFLYSLAIFLFLAFLKWFKIVLNWRVFAVVVYFYYLDAVLLVCNLLIKQAEPAVVFLQFPDGLGVNYQLQDHAGQKAQRQSSN